MAVKTILPRPQDLKLIDIDTAHDYVAYTFQEPVMVLDWQPSFIMVKKERGLGKGWHYYQNGVEKSAENILDLSSDTQIAYRKNNHVIG